MEKVRKAIMEVLICAGLMAIIWGGYFFVREQIERSIEQVLPDDFSWVIQIDEMEVKNGKLMLEGFAFELNQMAEEKAYDIVLLNTKSKKFYFPKMKYTQRNDVNEHFLCEYDYTEAGFCATISTRKVDINNDVYEILLQPRKSRTVYSTGVFLVEGKIMYSDPLNFVPLQVEGTELECIVNGGILRAYQPDVGVYIYQFEDALYWIIDEKYKLIDKGNYFQFRLNTTQKAKLPEHRLNAGWSWDSIGFDFEKNELLTWNCGNYRVAKAKIPTEYAISKIWTGVFVEDWIWKSEFRPYYFFD